MPKIRNSGMRRVTCLALVLCLTIVIGQLSCLQIAHAAQKRLSLAELPLPVQAYVLMEAVASGVDDPSGILSDKYYTFEFPNINGSDLNADGKKDYAVSLCMFADSTSEFRTNGFPCAFGNIIISNISGGYDFIGIDGIVTSAAPGGQPQLIVQQRNFGNKCSDYLCDFLYELKSGIPKMELELRETCEPNACPRLNPRQP